MPTFQVQCSECGKDKWPTLPGRPLRYVCTLCASVPAIVRQARREQGQKASQKRAGKP